MTEISNVKSSGQAVSLQPASAHGPTNGIGRFTASAAAVPTGDTNAGSDQLAVGQDPLEKAAKAIDKLVSENGSNTRLRIDKDDDTGRFIYKSVDKESGEVVKQFPPETILEIISHYRNLEGLVVDDKA